MTKKKKTDKPEDYTFHPERGNAEHSAAWQSKDFYLCEHVGPRGNRGIDHWWNHIFKDATGYKVCQTCDACTKKAIAEPNYPSHLLMFRSQGKEISLEEAKAMLRRGEEMEPRSEYAKRLTADVMDESKKGGIN
jgi:hypothetical protein